MKWTKETKVYMFANYFSEDGNWKAWDETVLRQSGKKEVWKHFWKIQNLKTGEIADEEFKTLKAAKAFAEEQ